jgi:hypothetical protein
MRPYLVIVERADGSLGVVKNPGEPMHDFILRAFSAAETLGVLVGECAARLDPADDTTRRIVTAGFELATAVLAFSAVEVPPAEGSPAWLEAQAKGVSS